ncbi:MAG: T9SS type A sorting domain-containing protein, partial [Bacteroidota bacterium]
PFDNGYYIACETESGDFDVSGSHGETEAWVLKLDLNGDTIWKKCYGGSFYDYARSIISTDDSCYMVIGSSASTDGDIWMDYGWFDYWLIKMDDSGDTLWTKIFGGSSGDHGEQILQTEDGDYLAYGLTNSPDSMIWGHHGMADFWVVRTDSLGDTLWTRCYGGSSNDEGYAMLENPDGSFILAGSSDSDDGDVCGHTANLDGWVMKINPAGDILWSHCFGDIYDDELFDICHDGNGGYMATGYSVTGSAFAPEDYWIIHIDSLGNLLWSDVYGGSHKDIASCIAPSSDGNFLIGGLSWSDTGQVTWNHGKADAWIMKINGMGAILWQHAYGGSDSEEVNDIMETADGGIIFTANSRSDDGDLTGNYGQRDIWIVKLCGYEFITDTSVCSSDSIFWHGSYYSQQGSYFDSLLTAGGCDSVFILNLVNDPVYLITDSISICNGDTISWHGQLIFDNGIFYDSLLTVCSADSIIELYVSMNACWDTLYFFDLSDTANWYIWHNGNSVDWVIENSVDSGGTELGNATGTLSGCTPPQAVIDGWYYILHNLQPPVFDSYIEYLPALDFSNEDSARICWRQWHYVYFYDICDVDVSNDNGITWETYHDLFWMYPTGGGQTPSEYCLDITDVAAGYDSVRFRFHYYCDVQDINTGGGYGWIVDNVLMNTLKSTTHADKLQNWGTTISIYPNPSEGVFHIDIDEKVLAADVFNIYGRVISTGVPRGNNMDLTGAQPGIYLIRIRTETQTAVRKIVLR